MIAGLAYRCAIDGRARARRGLRYSRTGGLHDEISRGKIRGWFIPSGCYFRCFFLVFSGSLSQLFSCYICGLCGGHNNDSTPFLLYKSALGCLMAPFSRTGGFLFFFSVSLTLHVAFCMVQVSPLAQPKSSVRPLPLSYGLRVSVPRSLNTLATSCRIEPWRRLAVV
jgi:hypothetical protein